MYQRARPKHKKRQFELPRTLRLRARQARVSNTFMRSGHRMRRAVAKVGSVTKGTYHTLRAVKAARRYHTMRKRNYSRAYSYNR